MQQEAVIGLRTGRAVCCCLLLQLYKWLALADHIFDHAFQSHLPAVIGRVNAGDAIRMQFFDFGRQDGTATAAENFYVPRAVGIEQVFHILKKFQVPALVRGDGDALHIFFNGTGHNIGYGTVMSQVDHFHPLCLQDAPHNIDGCIMPVKQGSSGNHSDVGEGIIHAIGLQTTVSKSKETKKAVLSGCWIKSQAGKSRFMWHGFFSLACMKNTVAFLFDMDGTLVNNMQYHLKAWEKIVGEAGSDLKGEALMKELYGKNSEVIERIFGKSRFTKHEVDQMSLRKEQYYHAQYVQHIKLLPGLKAFLEEARRQGVKMAVATAGLGINIDFIVDHTHTRGLFDAFVSDEDVRRSKPDPETFIMAAGKLDASPGQCIVFEDSIKGVEAAQQANMKTVAVLTGKGKADFAAFSNVIKMISDYKDISLPELFAAIGYKPEVH